MRKKISDAMERNKKNKLVLGVKIPITKTKIVKIKDMINATCLEEILSIFHFFVKYKSRKNCYSLINSNFMDN